MTFNVFHSGMKGAVESNNAQLLLLFVGPENMRVAASQQDDLNYDSNDSSHQFTGTIYILFQFLMSISRYGVTITVVNHRFFMRYSIPL